MSRSTIHHSDVLSGRTVCFEELRNVSIRVPSIYSELEAIFGGEHVPIHECFTIQNKPQVSLVLFDDNSFLHTALYSTSPTHWNIRRASDRELQLLNLMLVQDQRTISLQIPIPDTGYTSTTHKPAENTAEKVAARAQWTSAAKSAAIPRSQLVRLHKDRFSQSRYLCNTQKMIRNLPDSLPSSASAQVDIAYGDPLGSGIHNDLVQLDCVHDGILTFMDAKEDASYLFSTVHRLRTRILTL